MNVEKTICGCSFDCPGNCSMIATVRDGRIRCIEGNRDHPMTKGLICKKGKSHLDRVYHPDRILNPKRKVNGKWTDISYEDAMDEISRKLLYYRQEYGPESVLLYSGGAYKGLSKTVDKMFFNY